MYYRHIITIVLTSVAAILTVMAEDVPVRFSKHDFEICTWDGLHAIQAKPIGKIPIYDSDTLAPALPYFCTYVLIGPDEQFVDFSYTTTETVFATDINMHPNAKAYSSDAAIDMQTSATSIEYARAEYPLSQLRYSGCDDVDGYRILSFTATPFRYDTQSKTLFFTEQFNISITTKHAVASTSSTKAETPAYDCDSSTRTFLTRLVANPKALEREYPIESPKASSEVEIQSYYTTTPKCKFLIITNNAMKPAFLNLAYWKRQRGIWTEVITTEEIYSNSIYNAATNQQRIKKAIRKYYDDSEHALKYVLLGGSASVIPCQFAYGKATFSNKPSFVESIPTDLFYASLSKMDWDQNKNGIYGEPEDSVSLYPTVSLSRIPVNGLIPANGVIEAIKEYETSPSNWQGKYLMCGYLPDSYEYNGHTYYELTYKSEQIAGFIDIACNNYKQCHLFWHYYNPDTGVDSSRKCTGDELQSELDEGYLFVNVMSHGLNDNYFLCDSTFYTVHNIPDQRNLSKTIITTSACFTNAIDSVEYIGSTFLQNPASGVLGYWGSSRKGIMTLSPTVHGPSNSYTSSFYMFLMMSGDNRLGTAFRQAKIEQKAACDTNLSYRYLQFAINPLGDPTMHVFLFQPNSYNNLQAIYNNGAIMFYNNGKNGTLCITSHDDHGESFFMTAEITGGTFYQYAVPLGMAYDVCFSAPNYIPQIFELNKAQLQSESTDNYNDNKKVYEYPYIYKVSGNRRIPLYRFGR